MTNAEIADAFDQVADILEFQGANQFRVRAYRNAARTIRDLPESAADIVADSSRKLTDIEGIGKDLADKIAALATTGRLEMLEELKQQVPESVLSMMRVPGLGPKRAAMLFKELKVTTLEELRAACEAHKVRELKGFGAKTEDSILGGLQFAAEADKRVLWAEADDLVQEILAHMRGCPALEQIEAAGSYRRGRDTVGDLDFLAVTRSTGCPAGGTRLPGTRLRVAVVMDHFASYAGLAEVQSRGETKLTARLRSGLHVDLRVVPAESFGAAMQYFTGSKAHNVVVRGLAKERGLKVNEYGVFRGDEQIAGRNEEEVYAALDLPCFPPEMREARREFQWAAEGPLPRLLELGDIRGDLHMHSTWTDGQATIEQMALAAKARGLKYIAMTDHSKRVTMVNGLDETRILKQWEEIDKLNERLTGITVLKGVEVDILERGGLDLSDDVLKEADWVNASIHYGQNQSREQITRRVVDALQNPYVRAFAHPTGRMLTQRKPYEIDLSAVIRAAWENGKTLELNAHPLRLDLDDVACAEAKDHGVLIVISTDAHRIDGLAAMRYGVLQARRGGLTKDDVLNTRTWPQIKKLLGSR
jgi:DNA polymerase (family 10)